MANPIADSTAASLAQLDPKARAEAEASVARNTLRATGLELTLAEEICLAKAIKFVAATDGLSREETTALRFLMIMAGIPPALQREILDFELAGVTHEHVAELFPPRSRRACYLLSGSTTVAAIDGLSDDERAAAEELGRRLDLEPRLVTVLITEARATGMAMGRGDEEMVAVLQDLREALFGYF